MSGKNRKYAHVTMKTIAEKLGISVTTVSRSMEDDYKTSPETVAKVRDMANRLGYVRNLDGKKLRTGKTLAMMALLGSTREEEVGDSGSVGLLNGIHDRFAEKEYSVRTALVAIGTDCLDMVQKIVRGRNADGLFLDHTLAQDERIRFLLEQNHPSAEVVSSIDYVLQEWSGAAMFLLNEQVCSVCQPVVSGSW